MIILDMGIWMELRGGMEYMVRLFLIIDCGFLLFVIDVVVLGFVLIVMFLWCYVCIWFVCVFGVDDWLMVVVMIIFLVYCFFFIVGVIYGIG